MPLPSLLRVPIKSELDNRRASPQSILDFINLSLLDVVKWEDDFLGDTLHGGYQTATNGAAAAALAITAPTAAARHGLATMESGTDDNGVSSFSLGEHFYGENGAVMAAIVSINAVTSYKIEVGFNDQTVGTRAAGTDAVVNALGASGTAATFYATDGAVWCVDTDAATTWQLAGVANAVVATKVSPTNVGDRGQNAVPTADVRELLVVALSDGAARFMRADMDDATTDMNRRFKQTYDSGWQAGFVTNTVALTPSVVVQARAGAANRILTIDYFGAWQYRYLNY